MNVFRLEISLRNSRWIIIIRRMLLIREENFFRDTIKFYHPTHTHANFIGDKKPRIASVFSLYLLINKMEIFIRVSLQIDRSRRKRYLKLRQSSFKLYACTRSVTIRVLLCIRRPVSGTYFSLPVRNINTAFC